MDESRATIGRITIDNLADFTYFNAKNLC